MTLNFNTHLPRNEFGFRAYTRFADAARATRGCEFVVSDACVCCASFFFSSILFCSLILQLLGWPVCVSRERVVAVAAVFLYYYEIPPLPVQNGNLIEL